MVFWIVTYIYSAKAYEKIKETSIKLNYKLNSEITLYSNNELTIKKEITAEQVQKEKLGEIADITLENPNEGIYKGYMYNNKVTAEENKRETEIVKESIKFEYCIFKFNRFFYNLAKRW